MKIFQIAILIAAMALSTVCAEEVGQQLESALDHILKTEFHSDGKQSVFQWNGVINQHGSLAREMADGSVVLLKNRNNSLPLDKETIELKVAGPDAETVTILPEDTVQGDRLKQANIAVLGLDADSSIVRELKRNGNDPVIVIIVGEKPKALPEVYDLADAIIYAWQPDDNCGSTLAKVIYGEQNPSGRLPFAVPYFTREGPSQMEHSMKGRSSSRTQRRTPQFPFGFGLSFDQFEYTDISLSSNEICGDESLDVTVQVKNTGIHGGKEVVQLYLQKPGTGRKAPARKLVGLHRIHIPAGETSKVHFTVSPEQLIQSGTNGEPDIIPGAYIVTAAGAFPGQLSIELGMPKSRSKSFAVEKPDNQNIQANGS